MFLIHSDLWQSPTYSNNGYKYYILFVDDFSLYSWLYPLKKKSDAFVTFKYFRKFVENLFNTAIVYFQSDGSREYDNLAFGTFLLQHGIYFRESAPHTQQQNGVNERKHRHIVETAPTFLIDAHMPDLYWSDAVLTAVYAINRLPTPLLHGLSPFQKLFSKPPDYGFLRVFGSQCFPNLTPYTHNKLQPRSIRCVFIGYAPHYKAYKCLDPLTGRIYVSCHVIFHEHIFPYSMILASKPKSPLLTYFPSWSPISTQPHHVPPSAPFPLSFAHPVIFQ